MATWGELTAAEPEFMRTFEARFHVHRHKMLATLRSDGSPRISGIEVETREGELWIAGIPGTLKFADLRRDPRFSLHSTAPDSLPDDYTAWPGDAKLSGTAIEVTEESDERAVYLGGRTEPMPPGPFALFRADITEASQVFMGEPADHIVVERWKQGHGLRRTAKH
jgi:hypothetical protein